MANPSKIKGSAYEAKIRDLLTAQLKIEFKRMPLSGSLEYLKGEGKLRKYSKNILGILNCRN